MMNMRVVGLCSSLQEVVIQTKEKSFGEWKQIVMSYDDFESFMAKHFPKYWKIFKEEQVPGELAAEYFYDYGEYGSRNKTYIFDENLWF